MKSLGRLFIISVVSLASVAACSPYDPDLGGAPFLCGDEEPRCPDGYACKPDPANPGAGDTYCLSEDGTVPTDANNLNCDDDSQLEPNDDITKAWQTPVATQKNTLTFAGLAVCPAGDKDTYSVTITMANQNLEMIVEYTSDGAELQGSILNSGGIAIANASPTVENTKRAYTPNLPIGTYYAQAYGPAMGALQTNNYKLTINVTGP